MFVKIPAYDNRIDTWVYGRYHINTNNTNLNSNSNSTTTTNNSSSNVIVIVKSTPERLFERR